MSRPTNRPTDRPTDRPSSALLTIGPPLAPLCRRWLKGYQHIRYMWIPHTDAVVVVRSNPLKANQGLPGGKPKMSERDKMVHVRSHWVRFTDKG